jgi:phosphopantetheine adenylyltransferase
MDPGGPAVSEADLDAIVVSPEVAVVEGVKKINQTRVDAGMKPLDVLGIPLIKAPPSLRVFGTDDKISSTALRNRDKQRQEQAQSHK